LEWKDDGVMDDKSGDDDTGDSGEVRWYDTIRYDTIW